MTPDAENKKKKPRDGMELIAIEDRLEALKGVFRDIRRGMAEAGMPSVELSIGTFSHYLDLCDELAAKYKGEFNAQQIKHHAQAVRERKRAEQNSRMGKPVRK